MIRRRNAVDHGITADEARSLLTLSPPAPVWTAMAMRPTPRRTGRMDRHVTAYVKDIRRPAGGLSWMTGTPVRAGLFQARPYKQDILFAPVACGRANPRAGW